MVGRSFNYAQVHSPLWSIHSWESYRWRVCSSFRNRWMVPAEYLWHIRRKAVTFFPSPRQVASTELAILRTAGLSGRKAEYSNSRHFHVLLRSWFMSAFHSPGSCGKICGWPTLYNEAPERRWRRTSTNVDRSSGHWASKCSGRVLVFRITHLTSHSGLV